MQKESPLRSDSFNQMLKKVQDERMIIKFGHSENTCAPPHTHTQSKWKTNFRKRAMISEYGTQKKRSEG